MTLATLPSEIQTDVHPKDIQGTWFAAWIPPGRSVTIGGEAKYAAHLDRHGIGHYLPLQRVRRVVSGKSEVTSRPLFASYVFVAIENMANLDTDRDMLSPAQWYDAQHPPFPLRCQLIGGGNQKALIDTLATIYEAQEAGQIWERHKDFEPGRRVRVKAGHAFEGMEAIIDARDDAKAQITLTIAILGKPTECSISPEFLELT